MNELDERGMSFHADTNVMVAMRDGVRLATDVWVPVTDHPVPVVLTRTPYSKDDSSYYAPSMMADRFALIAAGYAVAWQDCRGTFRSEGDFDALTADEADAVDTIAWLRDQPWCDGVVGMAGASYLGLTQWAAVAGRPEGLQAVAPVTTSSDTYDMMYSRGGALSLGTMLSWSAFVGLAKAQRALSSGDPAAGERLDARRTFLASSEAAHDVLPVIATPLISDDLPWVREWLEHPTHDGYWQARSARERVDEPLPAFHLTGWFDFLLDSTLASYEWMTRIDPAGAASGRQQLVIGPWDHASYSGVYMDRQFGPSAHILNADVNGRHVRFYDAWLRGNTAVINETPPVRIFVMGVNQWRDEQAWPLPDTRYVDFHLSSGRSANSRSGGGSLALVAPTCDGRETYLYDPMRPVPSAGGRMSPMPRPNSCGPVDQREIEDREDVLCFSTEPLTSPIEVTGPIRLVLHVSSSARDTDFTGKLVDVDPEGRATYLTDGILRARYRDSLSAPALLSPDQVYEITVDLGATANVFGVGHRIRLEVSSSNFPRYDRNTNTGGDIATDRAEDVVIAVNRVLHGPSYPSRLILPVIER